MIYLILLVLVFVFAAMSTKLATKKIDALEARVYSLEEAQKGKDSATADTVANGEAVEVNK